jgi:hypothetical protein
MLVVATGVTQAPNDKQQVTEMLATLEGQVGALGKVKCLIADKFPILKSDRLLGCILIKAKHSPQCSKARFVCRGTAAGPRQAGQHHRGVPFG